MLFASWLADKGLCAQAAFMAWQRNVHMRYVAGLLLVVAGKLEAAHEKIMQNMQRWQ